MIKLSDGQYNGTLYRFHIEIKHQNTTFYLKIEEQVRGFGTKIIAHVKDGIAIIKNIKP